MEKVRIEKLRDQYRARAEKAYQNYQDSGDPRYYAHKNRAEDIACALQIAVDASDDYNTFLDLRACLSILGDHAARLDGDLKRDTCNFIDLKNFVKEVATEARIRGLIK